jgi:transcriptional regulator with XRE-family HTH domain
MLKKSRAAERLSQVVQPEPRRYTVSEVARKLNVSRQTVTSWCRGDSIPDIDRIFAIEDLLGIPAEAWRTLGENPRSVQWIYFIQRGNGDGPVKIGISKDPQTRAKDIQIACAEPVKILLLLSLDEGLTEREIHSMFEHLRIRGEWFNPGQDLLEWISVKCRQNTFK